MSTIIKAIAAMGLIAMTAVNVLHLAGMTVTELVKMVTL